MKNILVTGGAGFIGANFTTLLLERMSDANVFIFDKLTYAGDTDRLKDVESTRRYRFIRGDICDVEAVDAVFAKGIDAVMHFAAESHVDRSIMDATPFVESNVRGTLVILEAARRYGVGRFIHISTDEVYGEIAEGGFTEASPLNPNSPYSASKAGADLLVRAYHRTYGLPVMILRPTNNYGPWQYPEKLIPLAISRAADDRPIPVYGRGLNVREWLYVEDCALGVMDALAKCKDGEVYNIGSGEERKNIDVVKAILSVLGKPESLIEYVEDRPGHDFRYSLDSSKFRAETGWSRRIGFEEGIEKTVRWYLDNEWWWRGHTGVAATPVARP